MCVKVGNLFLAMLLILLLSSCNGYSEKSENEILIDVTIEDSFFSDYSLSTDESTVVKRQTNNDDKTDYVWLDVTASNEDFTYQASYELIYVLYNDGWLLEEYTKTNSYIEPKSYPSLEDAIEIMSSNFEDYEFFSDSQGLNSVSYSFQRKESYHYLSTNYITDVIFNFKPNSLWTYSLQNTETGYSLDIEGEWTYSDADRSFYINIIDVGKEINDSGQIDVILSYELENIHTSAHSTTTKSSNGPVRMGIDTYHSSMHRWAIVLDPYSVYGNISMYLGIDSKELVESTGYGLACDGYFLTRE